MSTQNAPPILPPANMRPTPFLIDDALVPNLQGDGQFLGAREGIIEYLKKDLKPVRLKRIHPYLWLAGWPQAARPLHRQKLLKRTIYLTESPDEHLVWHDSSIFIKPLPEYLLNGQFWEQRLGTNDESTRELRKSACGLLLSYVWLIRYRSDLSIAIKEGLVPENIGWERWVQFVTDFTARIPEPTPDDIDERYLFGELRLSRLNKLYHLGFGGLESRKLVRGFMSSSIHYTTFFERNFSWVLGVFIYITVVLSAMQVALATEKFSANVPFQKFSYGMALFSVAFVMAAVVAMILVWWSFFFFNIISTIRHYKKEKLKWNNLNIPRNVPQETADGNEMAGV